MRIIAFRTLRTFFEKPEYADSEASLQAWYHDTKTAEWISSNDLKQQYKHASIVGEGRVVFNIKGNMYLIIVSKNVCKTSVVYFYYTYIIRRYIVIIIVQPV